MPLEWHSENKYFLSSSCFMGLSSAVDRVSCTYSSVFLVSFGNLVRDAFLVATYRIHTHNRWQHSDSHTCTQFQRYNDKNGYTLTLAYAKHNATQGVQQLFNVSVVMFRLWSSICCYRNIYEQDKYVGPKCSA